MLTDTIFKCEICGHERHSLPYFENPEAIEIKQNICEDCKNAVLFVKDNIILLNKIVYGQTISKEVNRISLENNNWL